MKIKTKLENYALLVTWYMLDTNTDFKNSQQGWSNGLVVWITCCSCKGSRFNFHHGGSQPLQFQGIPQPLLISVGTRHIHAGKYSYTYNKIKISKRKSSNNHHCLLGLRYLTVVWVTQLSCRASDSDARQKNRTAILGNRTYVQYTEDRKHWAVSRGSTKINLKGLHQGMGSEKQGKGKSRFSRSSFQFSWGREIRGHRYTVAM